MTWAYVDSSLVIATIFGDHPPALLAAIWASADRYISSYLLQAEVLSAVHREKADLRQAEEQISRIGFLRTDSLKEELRQVFAVGYAKGADAFHLATALWVRGKHTQLKFLTLDESQNKIAHKLRLL